MGDDERDAFKEALDGVVARFGGDRVALARALSRARPPGKRGRPKGTTKYLDSDAGLMLAAYDEFLGMYARFHRDQAGRHPKPTTRGALMRVAKRAFERREYDGSVNTPEALASRLDTRFTKESAT